MGGRERAGVGGRVGGFTYPVDTAGQVVKLVGHTNGHGGLRPYHRP